MTDVPAGYSTGFVGQMTLAELAAFIALVASGAGDFNDIAITGSTIDSSVIGGTTPAAVNATTLAASSTVSGTGFSTYLASPPAIGGTAPAGVAATTLTSTGVTAFSNASVSMSSLPTSDPGVAGRLFTTAGAVQVSAG